MIPSTIATETLMTAGRIALVEQLASRAGTLDSPWGRIYRMIDNEVLRRGGHVDR